MTSLRGILATLVLGVAAAIVIVAVSIIPFLNPVFVGFEQDRAQAQAWTGWTTAELRAVTDAVLSDLILGPPTFDVALDGTPVLDVRERQHMADVRSVFAGFSVVAAGAALLLAAAFVIARGPRARSVLWGRLSRSGAWIAVITVVGGVTGVLFFDQAFELFHTLFFPAGSYTFDPGTERLVQLFPYQFWVETTIAVGTLVVALSLLLWWFGRRRAAANAAQTTDPAFGAQASNAVEAA
jgi:integral membrane protein (TIGR01906 family)